jgi:hypothetical protein
MPDWLRAASEQPAIEAEPGQAEPISPAEPAAPALEGGDNLPPWLRDEQGAPLPAAGAPGDTNLPTWLRGIDHSSQPPAPEAPRETPPAPAPLSLDWFDEDDQVSAAEPAAPPAASAASGAASSELLGGADLPAWLRRETEAPREAAPTDVRSLDWLSRLGPYEDEAAVATPLESMPRLSLPQPPQLSASQMQAVALLERLAAEPIPASSPLEQPADRPILQRIGIERILYLLLLVALLLALLTPGVSEQLQAPPPLAGAAALSEQIATLGPNDVVLLGYEWDAQRISELRPLERAVIDQLAAQKVKFVLVSTDPQGTMLQFDERDRLRAAGYQEGGADYVLLGYRPGNEFALRRLATNFGDALRSDFQGHDATIGTLATDPGTGQVRLTQLNDFAMVVVLADEPNNVQAWMEQIRPVFQKPMVFLVPASVQPLAQPYFRQPNVFSVAGTAGALGYEQAQGSPSPATSPALGELRLSTLIVCALLLAGTLISLVYRLMARRAAT